ADGGDPRPLTHHATGILDAPVWSPEGSTIYFLAREQASAAGRARTAGLVTFEETDFEQQHVWKVDVRTGSEQKVTSGDWSVVSYRLSRDGRHLTLLKSPTPLV